MLRLEGDAERAAGRGAGRGAARHGGWFGGSVGWARLGGDMARCTRAQVGCRLLRRRRWRRRGSTAPSASGRAAPKPHGQQSTHTVFEANTRSQGNADWGGSLAKVPRGPNLPERLRERAIVKQCSVDLIEMSYSCWSLASRRSPGGTEDEVQFSSSLCCPPRALAPCVKHPELWSSPAVLGWARQAHNR